MLGIFSHLGVFAEWSSIRIISFPRHQGRGPGPSQENNERKELVEMY